MSYGVGATLRLESAQSLRDVPTGTANNGNVSTLGYAANGDGGGGSWRYVSGESAGTYVDNGGTVVVPTGGDGSAAWLRQYSGPLDIRWFGADPTGASDCTDALIGAQDWAFRSTDYTVNETIHFPSGDYLFTQDNPFGQWSGTHRARVTFSGDGLATKIRFAPAVSTPAWLYNSEDSGGGAAGDNQLIGATFDGLSFYFDESNASAGAEIGGFNFYPKTGAPVQSFQFLTCSFRGASAPTYAGDCIRALGTINASENVFVNCKFKEMRRVVYSENQQALNWSFVACDAEGITGDFLHFEGGSQLTWVGGSFIAEPDSPAYILRISGSVGGNFVFTGIRPEFRNTNARLYLGEQDDNSSVISFRDCDLNTTIGGDRESVRMQSDSAETVVFENCLIAGQGGEHLFAFSTPTVPSFWVSYRRYARILIDNCRLPVSIQNNVTWDSGACALFRVSGGTQSGGAVTDVPSVALDWESTGKGQMGPRSTDGPRLKTHCGLIAQWPTGGVNELGLNSQVILPAGSFLRSISIRKKVTAESTDAYQLALINGDGTSVYAVGDQLTFDDAHSIDWAGPALLLGSADTDRTIRLVNTVSLAYTSPAGQWVAGETVTDSVSGAYGQILSDSGTELTLALVDGTFGLGNAITSPSGSGTAGATVDFDGGATVLSGVDSGNAFILEYL